jgi:hypothetical protein
MFAVSFEKDKVGGGEGLLGVGVNWVAPTYKPLTLLKLLFLYEFFPERYYAYLLVKNI